MEGKAFEYMVYSTIGHRCMNNLNREKYEGEKSSIEIQIDDQKAENKTLRRD